MAERAMVLVGDIGGTQARLALLPASAGRAAPVRQASFPSRDYAGLEPLVSEFLGPHRAAVVRAVFAVAGPVVNGRATLTNLSWALEEGQLEATLGVGPVRLINDVSAMASAVPHLEPESLHTLQRGVPAPEGSIAVLAPGTGLGEAFLTWTGTSYRTHPSEGGHADFAPTDALQVELLRWLQARVGHVSYERVCSGRGLPDLYRFLNERGCARGSEQVAAGIAAATDPTPVIVQAATDPAAPCALCVATVELFADILAAEAANVALRVLATGGVYLGGGLPRRLLGVLSGERFVQRFRQKGRLSPLLERIPLHVLVRPNIALLGAMHLAVPADATLRDTSPT